MRHTPGPWRIQEEHWKPEGHSYSIWIESPSDPETLGAYSGRKIAEIHRSLGIQTSAANAALIAAAPELLEAAKGLMAEFDAPVPDLTLKTLYRKKLRDAIAKAEGRS